MERVAILGAGGKMGFRITGKLTDAGYSVDCIEPGDAGRQRLTNAGFSVAAEDDVLPKGDAVVLAVPDSLIGIIAKSTVPKLKPGAILISLDPAAPLSGKLPERTDVSYFVTHPCHPSVFKKVTNPDAIQDRFGGIAEQPIVCTLLQGPEEDYKRGEDIAKHMFAPVNRAHRISLEQMAVLEPAMAETVSITLLSAIREAMDEAIAHGVPEAAAKDFLLGHIGVELAILFNEIDAQLSDGAKKAARRGAERILQKNWKDVFQKENIMKEIYEITRND